MTRRIAPTRRRNARQSETGTVANGGGGRPRVVVVGGGFAGLSTVREFGDADVDVLLLDRDLYSTFQPLLYQVATGGLNPGDVTYALRAFVAQIRRLIAAEPTEPMVYKDKGAMATIGHNAAVAQLPKRVRLKGRVAWLAWVALHIVTLMGQRNRLATLANLSVRYLAWPGRLNVIGGDPP
jgi:NADH dehydrogenase FAD-containing subunit